ncbi:hypothetical protein Micbo1qcDRAFT_160624 [Microdochium bolleyi]|uniref:Uncharacterized protein n=1 Tax=Microdochium bolleyi TaxID=196109 RepID=A0A136J6J5_9PEZI|nr:hypothetical protein Micbo1qcDRAFT_160624 [Microdochium bolleyi]
MIPNQPGSTVNRLPHPSRTCLLSLPACLPALHACFACLLTLAQRQSQGREGGGVP